MHSPAKPLRAKPLFFKVALLVGMVAYRTNRRGIANFAIFGITQFAVSPNYAAWLSLFNLWGRCFLFFSYHTYVWGADEMGSAHNRLRISENTKTAIVAEPNIITTCLFSDT